MKMTRRILLSFVLLGVLAGCAGMQQSSDNDALAWLMQEDDRQQGGE